MTYDQLAAFLAVARCGSFNAASMQLHKSQPAVSKLIRNLEEELGVHVFDRSEYRASLTDAGRLLLERASTVIEHTESLRSFAAALSGKVEPIVRLAVESIAPLAPVLCVLRDLQADYPSVRIELSTVRLGGAGESLQDDRADVAIASKLASPRSSLESSRYGRVRIVPVAHRDHALTRTARSPDRAMLRTHAQIVLSDGAASDRVPTINLIEGGHRWNVSDVAAKKEVILAGMGWGGLPEHLVRTELESGDLVELDIPEFEADAIDLFVYRRRDRPCGVVAQSLWNRLGEGRAA